MPVKTESTMLKSNALKNPFTVNPCTNFSANSIIKAFMANKKNPKVKIVMGIVKMVKIGLTIVFKKANTTATKIAEV
jgi:hypothetical protein